MTEPKYLAVLDASVLVRAFLASSPGSAARLVVEAAVLGVFDVILSDMVRQETYEVLGRPALGGYQPEDVDAVLGPLWSISVWVDEVDDPDGSIAGAATDPDDAYLLRTAGAVYEGRVAWRKSMFIVTENTRDFPTGSSWGDFRYVDCVRFLQRLR